MVPVAQWQSATLWMWMLWVQAPSGTPRKARYKNFPGLLILKPHWIFKRDGIKVERNKGGTGGEVEMKTCTKCGIEQDESNFSWGILGIKRHSWCKSCRAKD